MTDINRPSNNRICMVTGATSGIGAATALALAGKGICTILVGRSQKKCEKVVNRIRKETDNSSVEYFLADLSSQQEIFHLAGQFRERYQVLDILINNAGAKFVSRLETADGYEMTFALNHLAYFLLTNLLLDCLNKSEEARIVNVSSGAHGACSGINFDDLHFKEGYVGKEAYAQSKLANLLFTYELSRRLERTKIAVNAVTPGGVATNFCRNNGWVSWLKHITAHILARNLVGPAEGAKTSLYVATAPEIKGVSGRYYANQKEVRSSRASHDEEAAKSLWDVSVKLTGLESSNNRVKNV